MKNLTFLRSLLAAFCFAAPATGLSHDHHHHDYHGHDHYYGSIYRPYPYFYAPYPYYDSAPSFGLTFYSRPYYSYEDTYYRGVPRYNDYGDDLSVDVQRALLRRGYLSLIHI